MKTCSNCQNQLTGFDGGFGGLPFTCECKVYGETGGRKNCQHFKKRLTVWDLLEEIHRLKEENKQLRICVDEADDLIQSHLSEQSSNYFRNYCKALGVEL